MKKIITILFLLSSVAWGQNVWMNEIHYDNSGTDTGEFIEIALENANTYNLSDFTITLYNGSNGKKYNSKTLDNFTQGITNNNITLFYYDYPSNGIQNGSPDGVAIDYQGTLIQFLSYEGTFTATDGPANGVTSTDIGVSENSSTPIGQSLQLSGNGTQYSDFTWNSPAPETKGTQNNNQALPVELTTFSASIVNNSVELKWQTATEVNNYGFYVERKSSFAKAPWKELGFVNGHGNSNSPKEYSFIDKTAGSSGKYFYRLKQVDVDGQFEYSPEIEVAIGAPAKFELSQNYPNPFNPTTNIKFALPEAGNVKLAVYNLLGQKVADLVNRSMEAGFHNITFNGSNLTSGIYIYRLEAGNNVMIRKMQLVK